MLIHHSKTDYNVAASDAAKHARTHFEGLISEGRKRAQLVLQQVHSQVPQDRIVRGQKLVFLPRETPQGHKLVIDFGETAETIHRHALNQLSDRVEVPFGGFVNKFSEKGDWGAKMVADVLTRVYQHDQNKYLLRSVKGDVRGFLSDKFRRLDSRPLLDAFAKAVGDLGAVPIQGYAMDTRVMLKAILPHIFEPVPNEVLAFGLCWSNSDFGAGKHAVQLIILRLWCTNYAIGEDLLTQVHLGKRLDDNFTFSQRTYELDTAAAASAVKDIVEHSLAPKRIDALCNVIKVACEESIDPKAVVMGLKKHLQKEEVQKVIEAFNSPDVQNLPPGNNLWRMSNAVSWIAGQTENEERKVELMKVAGDMLPLLKAA